MIAGQRLALRLLLLVLLAACAPAGPPASRPALSPTPLQAGPPPPYRPEAARREGGTATVGDWQLPKALHPLYPEPAGATYVEQALFDGLVGVDPSLGYFGALAQEAPTPENGGVRLTGGGMDVTYELRPGLRWSDGAPITPGDVAFTWRVQPKTAGYDLITGVDRTGDLGVTVHFRSVYPPYLLLFPVILPAHRLAGIDPARLADDPYWSRPDVVSGPFQVADASGDRFVLVRNPHYAEGRAGMPVLGHAAHLDRLVFQGFATKSAEEAALQAGDVDVALELNERDLDVARRIAGARLSPVPSLAYEQVTFNLDDPLFKSDRALVDALARGLDRRALADRVLGGRAPLAEGPISSLVAWVPRPPGYPTDPAAARRELDAEGWAVGAGGIRVRAGQPLQLTLVTTADSPLRASEADAIAASYRTLGVDVRVQAVPADQLFAGYPSGVLARGAFQAALWSWVVPPDPDGLFAVLDSAEVPSAARPAGQDFGRCRSREIDAALADGRVTLDRAHRADAYRRFEIAYQAAGCEVPLFQRLDVGLAARRLHNFAPNPTAAGNTWNVADWWLDSMAS